MHLLDNPIWDSLTTDHAEVAIGDGLARAYPIEVLPFVALQRAGEDADRDVSRIIEKDRSVGILGVQPTSFEGWEISRDIEIAQYLWPGTPIRTESLAMVSPLGPEDAPAMLDLTSRVYPAFFRKGTAELGPYFGIKIDGRLAAMAGVRMAFPGYGEISAVCVEPDFRGRGFAQTVTARVIQEIESAHRTPFLHTEAYNAPARALYEKMGFELYQTLPFLVLKRL